MKPLRDFVIQHTDRNACRCGQCIDFSEDKKLDGHTCNVFFFNVCLKDNPDPARFRELIEANPAGDFCELNPFDGKEHSYIEIGGWIGDQGLALQFMGLGELLGLWGVMHPGKIMPADHPLAKEMAGAGMVSLMPKGNASKATQATPQVQA